MWWDVFEILCVVWIGLRRNLKGGGKPARVVSNSTSKNSLQNNRRETIAARESAHVESHRLLPREVCLPCHERQVAERPHEDL